MKALGIVVVIGLVAIAIGSHSSSNGKTSTSDSTASSQSAEARFALTVNGSHCGEAPSLAYITCRIAVKNMSYSQGESPEVYVLLRYTDGSSTIVDNATEAWSASNEPGGFTAAPRETRWITIQHSYDPTRHRLIQAAASLDLNADQYPYISVTS
jgi:hypothetical protein